MITKVFIALFITIIAFGCSEKLDITNQKPNLNSTNSLDGLKITFSIHAIDPDGSISKINIAWGDNKIENLLNRDFSNLEVSHFYSLPKTYNITIIAIDDKMDSTIQSFPITMDYKETSLNGIKESMFKVSENEFLILTINLHTYQETQQNEKFNTIIDVIGKMDIDFVAFQECGQKKSSAIKEGIIRTDNMALIISEGLKQKHNADYSYIWDWAHYGWDVYEEGVAVLSKHPLVDSEARYISTSTGTSNIGSRKAIYGSYQVTQGIINIFSTHTHWRTSLTDEEQNNQVKKIKAMVLEKDNSDPTILSFVCGDFNGNPTSDYPWSEGYNTMLRNNEFKDTFLEINPLANNKPAQSIYNTVEGEFPGRIDYIFMKNNATYKVVDSQILLTDAIIGKVSDHYGVLTKVMFIK